MTVRHETKFAIPAHSVPTALSWLEHVCAPDPAFNHNIIHSLYFDTPSLALLDSKIQSDYLKTKVRLRWYSNIAETVFSDAAYLEVKSKEGYLGGKRRAKVPLAVPEIHKDPIGYGAKLNLADYLDPQIFLHGRLIPICVIRYQRRRFIDIGSGSRLALDDAIEVTAVNDELFLKTNHVLLDEAVIEVKGPTYQNIPPSLLSLQNFIRARRTAFSKYGQCLSLLTIHHTGE